MNYYKATVKDTNGENHDVYLPDSPEIGGGASECLSLNSISVYLADFVNDDITVISGGIDEKKHIIKS